MSLFDDFLESTQQETRITQDDQKILTPPPKINKRETGFVAAHANKGGDPLFSLQYVQFQLPASLVSMTVKNNILAAVLDNFRILRIDLDNPLEVDVVEISRKASSSKVTQLFLDPTGRHIIVTTDTGDNFYLYQKWRRTKELAKLKGVVITSIAWNKRADMNSTTTREILIGTSEGLVYETWLEPNDEFFRREEKYVIQVFSLHEPDMAITGLSFERFPSDRRKYLVMLSTPTRLYHFVGSVRYTNPTETNTGERALFEPLFAEYQQHPQFQELPSKLKYSKMLFFNRFPELQSKGVPQMFVWLTGAGIYQGDLDFVKGDQRIIDNAQLLPFPPTSYDEDSGNLVTDIPISIVITEFHYILLYQDYVRAVCRLNDKIVFEEIIPLNKNEIVRGISVDELKRTYWIYTSDAIYELVIKDEERDVWKLYLQKKQYTVALQYCKDPSQKTQVYTAQAKEDFDQRRYMQSAKFFAKSTVPFEEVALKFTQKKERDALRFFLISRLERLGPKDKTQKTLISTWLVELYLFKMNQLEDLATSVNFTSTSGTTAKSAKYYHDEQTSIKDEFRTFLETYGENLHVPTTYKLISSHGRHSEILYYAFYIGDYEKVIDNWIFEKNWDKAIQVLDKQVKNDLFYKFSSPLMENVPEKTVDMWIHHPNLNPRHLIPALLRYNHANRIDRIAENQAIRYLSYVVSVLGNTDSVIHNFLLTLYATQPTNDETALLTFLKNEGREMHYKLDYALRICNHHGRTQSCVHIYSEMGLYEEAVDLALGHRDLDLARVNADKPEDDDVLRKRLWVNIAKYVIQDNKDIKSAMQFLKKCDLLKMEDILPFFPDFVLIDDFKDEICSALEEYNISIEELKMEMDNATSSADHIRLDIRKLKKRFAVVKEEQTCYLCEYPLLTRQFYVFSCNHQYHADCLINRSMKYLPTRQIRKLADIQEQLSREYKLARTMLAEDEKAINARIEGLRYDLDDIVAHQCLMCGDAMINTIHLPFVGEDEAEVAASWAIN
ncbi:Pep3/Vps18/deep orange family-domain-containing protein [Mucor mucedo]|uniref:Pep3/Vps18/deep orange family-domain-containing protein n=1 Tax=Mucor mucedo TaxID=29922 RepID=UPI00221F421B|nr:Pep3/Vps18/deep orange family-domain-containing protein [Mucor mucedo]KAI7887643.1 Pep3/Vps18/deep orange family-domain-containing protein [Mucor mucedo]